ncbi:MAG: alpha/beta hydrolase [Candidatus Thorarchaeota archaeon]
MALRRRYLVLILGLIIMLSGVSLAAGTQMGYGTVNVTEVNFQAADGSLIHSTLQRPTYATNADPLPGVVVIHGSLQNKEWLMAFGIELARRGFVVLTIDANGHGNSEAGSGSGAAALDYIAALDYVDSTQIGLIGHSMGGGISWSAMEDSSVNVRALVLVGSGFWSTASYTPNTLLATGNFDSLSSYPHNWTRLDPYFNVTGVVPNTTYGDFANNTARRAVFPSTNHLFETIDPVIVRESLDWMKNSLKGGVEDEHWAASNILIYPFWLVGGFMGLLGAMLTVLPIMVILLDTPLFADLRRTTEDDHEGDTKSLFTNGIIYAVIGAGSFFPFLLIGQILSAFIPFPQYYGIPVMMWMTGSGLLALLVLFLILWFRRRSQVDAPSLTIRGLLGLGEGKTIRTWINTLILSIFIFTWLYFLTSIVDRGFVLDLRCFLPGLHDLTNAQAIIMPIYFVVFLLYFVIEGAWLTGPMLQKRSEPGHKSQIIVTTKAIFIKTIPYLFLIGFEFVGGYLAGAPLVPGIIGYSWLFFYAFTPWFAICTVFTMYAYQRTGNRWLGAMVNALLCAWLLASILSFRG